MDKPMGKRRRAPDDLESRMASRNRCAGRRRFLGQGLMVALAALGERLWAQAAVRYLPLSQPVLVPLADLGAPGRARPFMADAVTLASASTPNQAIRVAGLAARTTAGDNVAERFAAVCARCPHEGCDVDFVPDPGKLPPEVVQEIGRPLQEPVYLCPCHNSTFALGDGARLGGPAPRGLYRFRVTRVSDTVVEIGEVEEDVLIFF